MDHQDLISSPSSPPLKDASTSAGQNQIAAPGNLQELLKYASERYATSPTYLKGQNTKKLNAEEKREGCFNKAWRDLSAGQKFLVAGLAADSAGAEFFTLRLSNKRQTQITKADIPIRALYDRLNRTLGAHGFSQAPYGFTVERSARDQLHLHGFVVCEPDGAGALKAILLELGGQIMGRAAARQLEIKRIYEGFGAAEYCMKAIEAGNPALVNAARPHLSNSMKRVAQTHHKAHRILPAAKGPSS